MAAIELTARINAHIGIVFDLSRSIKLHTISTSRTSERAVAGTTEGLININESVTWEARHLFKKRSFTSKITAFEYPVYFRDVMQKGDFKNFSHEHFFSSENGNVTLMRDKLLLEAPHGFAGKLAMQLFLRSYIARLLLERNECIKSYAESGKWKSIL